MTATVAAATTLAAAVAVKSYKDNPPSLWPEILTQRRHSPIWDSESRLAGSVGDPDASLDADAQRNFAYIPLSEAPPPTFVDALKLLEDRGFGEGAWRICGVNALALVWRWASSGGIAGGSGIVQMHTRGMKAPDWGNEKGLLEKAARKFRELGAACSVWESYTNKGGANAILSDFAGTVPMLQGGGTLRGLESAAHITFGVKPSELTDAQQILFAAAVKLPLRLLQAGDLDVSCEQVYPLSTASFDATLAAAHPARFNQCRVLWRALSVAAKVLQGSRLAVAQEELRAMQRDGIQVANEFRPVPATRLINLTARTAAMLPPIVTRMMVNELDSINGFEWGDPISLTFDATSQRKLGVDVKSALTAVQRTGRQTLCIPLIRTDLAAGGFTPLCGMGVVPGVVADTIALKMKVDNGALVGVHASSPAVLDAPLSAGSIAKWAIVLAAVEAGLEPESPWCPRRVFDGARQLRRVGADPYGYTDAQCARGGKYLVRLVDAIARSDNLVAAEVARNLGDERLTAALTALGLKPEREHEVWYSVAFGTQPATPRTLLAAGRALVAAAYGIEMIGAGPRVLAGAGQVPALGSRPIELPSLTPVARASLRRLLEAPVSTERGTFRFAADVVTAAKTGTTNSSTFDVNGHRNVHAKLAISYQAAQGTLNLLIVAAPSPSVPLALHNISAALLAPVHRALLQPR